jgi:hypothetical protein
MKISPRIRSVLSVPVLALALTGAAGGAAALMAATPAGAVVAPNANYQMYGTACANSPCGLRVTITENVNNAAVRANLDCSNGTTLLGGWHTAVGSTSATAQCPNGSQAQVGWEEWNMSQHHFLACWVRPDNWNGPCTGG